MCAASAFDLVTLAPDINERDFLLYLTLAHRFTQDRPWAFAQSGGYSLLHAYLDKARRLDQKNVGVFTDGAMISLITIEKEPGDAYLMHVTSPKRSYLPVIVDAAYAVVWQLFDKLKAERVYTMSPVFRGRHSHRGSIALCRACGGRETGHVEKDGQGNLWVEYAMTRQDWLEGKNGQKKN